MAKKVLIIGAGGMLGQALLKEFGDLAIGWDKKDVDVTNFVAMREKIMALRPDVIINAAAYNDVDKMETNDGAWELAKKINGEAVGEMARAAKEICAIFVHYSSDYVFDGSLAAGYTEDIAPQPINKYGETKLLGEKLVQKFGEKFYLIRLSRLFGGAGVKKSFVDKMLELYNGGQRDFNLVDEELSSPTYAPDAANFTRKLLESGKPWGIYHGANFGACTWHKLAKEIFAIKNYDVCIVPISSVEYPRPASRPHKSILLNTKFNFQRPWQEALKEYLQKI